MKKIFAVISILTLSVVSVSAFAANEKKISADKCTEIKTSLVDLQHADSRARVYLGRYYEIILTKYIVPLNMRLVENSLSEQSLIDNQNQFKDVRQSFVNDYITYQKSLESLVAMNCEEDSSGFYDKLVQTRTERQTVAQDIVRLRNLMKKQVEMVTKIMGKIK